jgi:hypothetical protein
MNKLLEKFLVVSIIIPMLIIPTALSVNGDQPVIASRISRIIYITVITDPDFYKSNNTLFGIEVDVEILNKDTENQTVIELSDFTTKVLINASFVNQSLVIEQIIYAHATIMHYSYQPGITVEHDLILFYINQTGLSHLPDGNYTLWRPIDIGTVFNPNDIAPGEQLITVITMKSGTMNITHSYFDIIEQPTEQPTDEVNFPLIYSLAFISIFSYVVTVFFRRKHRSIKSFD